MPTTRQKRKSTEAENAIPAENITLPAKLKRNDEKPLKNSRKNGPTGGVESANLRTRSKKQDSKKFVDSSSSSQRKRKKEGETTDASLKEDMSKNSENCTKRSVTTKERTCALKNINKIKTEKNSTEKKIIKRKTCQPKSAESASHDKEESKKVKMLSEGSLTDKGDQQDEKSGASESDDDFDVISSCENVSKVMLKNSKVKSGKQIGAKKIRKTSVSGEVVTRKGKKSQTKKIETKSNSAGKSHIPKIERILTKVVKPKNDLGKSKDSMTNIKLMKEEDVTTVLMQMEGKVDETDGPLTMDVSTSSKEEMDSSAESDWEEVADHPFGSPNKSQIPSGPVQVRLEVPDIMKKKRKKKTFDAAAYCRRLINRFEKNCLIQLHKVHMMCLLSHGLHCARLGQRSILKAQALSLVPTEFLKKRPKSYDSQSINSLTMWFSGLLVRDPDLEATSINQGVLVNRFSNQKVSTGKELVLMLFSLLTVLGLDVRIIFSMQPMPWKTTLKDSGKTADRKSRTTKNSSQKSHGGKDVSHKQDQPSSSKKQEGKTAHNCKKSENQTSKYFKESQNRKLKGNLKNSHLQETEKTSKHDSIDRRDHSSKKKSCTGEEKQKSTSNSNKRKSRVKNSLRRSCASKLSKSQNEQTLSEESANEFEEESGDSDYSNYSDEEQGKKVQRKPRVQKTAKKTKSTSEDLISSSDFTRDSPDEFEEETVTFRKSPAYNMNRKYKEKTVSRKVVSSDTDDSRTPPKTTNKKGNDWWLEVFSEKDEKWICVDVVHNVVNKPEGMEKSATQPITYVIAFDNHGCVKDVTSRYASQWMSHTRKLRVDVDWWEETIEPYRTLNTQQDRLEDLVLKAEQIKKPLPQVVGEYKNHPLYALRRHLLKFEAIYPDTAVPLGYVRNEPVYARECVHTLHSRDNWLKEGRIVKLGMTPYKMVKSRPKWNKPKENPDELDLEVFGVWQTDIYVPPPAENGKIYKNEYGNIELFKPTMLPAGTVHIRIEGLKRVAKKLDIDCVPAMVGWDHHSGCAHPVLDGFVVCKEHEDILLSAWEEDQEQQRQREILKKQKRVYGNWKLFVRGLLIKERLKKRFDLETASHPDKAKLKTGSGEKATDTECSWPRNRQNKTKSKKQSKQDCLVEVEQL